MPASSSCIHNCLKLETNPNALQLVNEQMKYGTATKWMEYYSAIKRNEALIQTTTSMNLKCILQVKEARTMRLYLV